VLALVFIGAAALKLSSQPGAQSAV